MTIPIDIGSGINASELFGDLWSNAKDVTPSKPSNPSAAQADFKTTYLETQKAIIDKDIEMFKSGLQKMQGALTVKQTNMLGREILRNFDQRFADALTNCSWDELVTADTTMAQANKESVEGFTFCINILSRRDREEDGVERHFCWSELREVFARLSHITANNHQIYDACRRIVAPKLKMPHKQYAIEDAIEQVYTATPQNVVIFKGLMDNLAQMEVNWCAVFNSKHPFVVNKQKDLFGALAFFQRHPKIFDIYNAWAQEEKIKYEAFYALCEKTVFQVSSDTQGDLLSILSSDFKIHAGDKVYRWITTTTPNTILSAFKNYSNLLPNDFKNAIVDFAAIKNPERPKDFCHVVASEILFERDPNFLTSVLSTSNGLAKVNQYAAFPPHLEVLAHHVLNAPPSHQKALLDNLAAIADINGNTISHVLACELSTENLKDPAIQKLVLLCMKHNWSTQNTAGETPAQLFDPPSEEMGTMAKKIFKQHLAGTITQHLKDNKMKPQKTTQRKI